MKGDGIWQLAALAALLALISRPASAEEINLRTTSIPLTNQSVDERQVGELEFLAGLWLRSSEKTFGGLSGLHISPDGKTMLAVSDMGRWFQADLLYDENGALTDVRNARLTPMLGTNGKSITGKLQGDAEDVIVADDGIYVSFERNHRIWRYPLTDNLSSAVPSPIPMPGDIRSVRSNKGLEALVRLPDDSMLLLTEESLDRQGHIRGWLREPNGRSYAPIRLQRTPPFAVTGAALLPGDADILILERRFSHIGGLGIKLRRIATADVRAGALLTGRKVAEFAPDHTIDNFEGIAAIRNSAGSPMVFILSDDNFNGFQRTLLMHFRMEDSDPARRR